VVGRLREWWWVPLLYTLAVMWIYRDLWHQRGVATGLGWDTIDTHGPDLDFFSTEIREGRFSLWNPYDKGGYPLFCDPVFDRYYPFNWPFALWGAIAGSSWWLVQIKVMAHHVVAGLVMHIFLRSRDLSHRAAMTGGLGLVASAPLLVHKASNILWPIIWVPLVWLAIDFALARPSWRRGIAIGAALLLPMTAGSPPGLFYAGLLILPYATWRLIAYLLQRPSRRELIQLAVSIACAGTIAALVLAVTVVPTGDLVALGSRDRFAPPGPNFALMLSLQLSKVMRGVGVRGAGLPEVYMGAAIVFLALCALVVRPRHDRGAAIVLGLTALFGLWLASGETGGLLTILVYKVPGFAMLRVPGRYKLIAAWSLAAAAGYGVSALEAAREEVRLRIRMFIVVALAIAATVILVLKWGHAPSPAERPAWWSIVATAFAALLALATIRAPRRFSEAALGCLALCALLDAPLFTFTAKALPAAERRQTHAGDETTLAKFEGIRDRWRVYDEFLFGERAGARLRIRDFRGYPAVDPISLHRYVDVLDFAAKDAGILEDFNVRYLLIKPHFRYASATSFPHMPHPEYQWRHDFSWEAVHPAPLIQWVGQAVVVPQKQVLSTMRSRVEPNGWRWLAVLEPSDQALLPASSSTWVTAGDPTQLGPAPEPVEGQLVSYEPDEIRFTIDAPRDGLVMLNEIQFPGWHVEVDGKAATPLRANYLLRTVWVPQGHHSITWRFEPRRWRFLLSCYCLALISIFGTALFKLLVLRRQRRDTRPA
jgi:hypothetical protein